MIKSDDPTRTAWTVWGGVPPCEVFFVSRPVRHLFNLYTKQFYGVRVLGKTVKLRRRRWKVSD